MSDAYDLADPPLETLPLAMLPLDAWHRSRGGRMVPFAGYDMPIQYEGIVAEHLWTRESAGLFDVSHMGQLQISGENAAEALESVLPGDIVGLGLDRVRYSLLLDEDGGILDDLMVTRRDDGFYLVVNGAMKHDDIGHLREYLPDEITINHMESSALLALQGPLAVRALERVVPGVAGLYFMEAGRFGPLWISRSGYTGEDGFEISVSVGEVEQLAAALAEQPEVRPIGLGARDSLRLEAGLPLYGHDLDSAIDPVTAGVSFAIPKRRREAGGYPGAQAIAAHVAHGTLTQRVGLVLEGRQPAREGAEIFLGRNPRRKGHVGWLFAKPAGSDRNGLCRARSREDRHRAGHRRARKAPASNGRAAALRPSPLSPQRSSLMRYFTKEHEWIDVDGAVATVGITDYAQSQLGDIVFVEMPATGASLTKGGDAAVVESVKAASDVYAPVSGTVTEANAALEAEPSLVNSAPEAEGWFFRLTLSNAAEVDGLMDAPAYQAFVAAL